MNFSNQNGDDNGRGKTPEKDNCGADALAYFIARAQSFAASQDLAIATQNAFIQAARASLTYAPPKLEHEVKAGEILAWRAFAYEDGFLTSTYKTMYSWPADRPLQAHKISEHWGEGIHAWKTKYEAEYYAGDHWIVGSVLLWGEVVEFDHGYHAEFARLHSIERVPAFINGRPAYPFSHYFMKRALRKKYLEWLS